MRSMSTPPSAVASGPGSKIAIPPRCMWVFGSSKTRKELSWAEKRSYPALIGGRALYLPPGRVGVNVRPEEENRHAQSRGLHDGRRDCRRRGGIVHRAAGARLVQRAGRHLAREADRDALQRPRAHPLHLVAAAARPADRRRRRGGALPLPWCPVA